MDIPMTGYFPPLPFFDENVPRIQRALRVYRARAGRLSQRLSLNIWKAANTTPDEYRVQLPGQSRWISGPTVDAVLDAALGPYEDPKSYDDLDLCYEGGRQYAELLWDILCETESLEDTDILGTLTSAVFNRSFVLRPMWSFGRAEVTLRVCVTEGRRVIGPGDFHCGGPEGYEDYLVVMGQVSEYAKRIRRLFDERWKETT